MSNQTGSGCGTLNMKYGVCNECHTRAISLIAQLNHQVEQYDARRRECIAKYEELRLKYQELERKYKELKNAVH